MNFKQYSLNCRIRIYNLPGLIFAISVLGLSLAVSGGLPVAPPKVPSPAAEDGFFLANRNQTELRRSPLFESVDDLFPEISRDGHKSAEQGSLDGRVSTTSCDRAIVEITEEEWRLSVELESKVAVIGRFAGRDRPSMDLIRTDLRSRITGVVQIGSLSANTILLRFASEEDCKVILARNRMTVAGASVWLSRWSPDWKPWKDSPLVPVWIAFPNLPLHLFNSFDILCGSIGKFLFMDSATMNKARPSVARVRVEVDLSKPLVHRVWIKIGNGLKGFWQRVEYEWMPRFCLNCFRFGHVMSGCRRHRDGDNTMKTTELNVGGGVDAVESVEVEELNVNKGTPTVCQNDHMGEDQIMVAAGVVESTNKGIECVQEEKGRSWTVHGTGKEKGSTPPVCGNASMRTLALEETEQLQVKAVRFGAKSADMQSSSQNKETSGMDDEKEKEGCEEGGEGDQTQEESSSEDEEEESSQSVSYRTWAENLKNKVGENSDLVKVIEEAKHVVDKFFQCAFKELGKEIYDECSDELVKKANEIFVWKLEREGKEVGSKLKKELGWNDRDSPATKKNENCESEGSSNASSKKKGRVIKNEMDWVGIVKEFMGKDTEFERRVKEAMKAVNDYLWTVFDKEKKAYLEEGKARALRGAAIFLEIVKQRPAWGAENNLLGRILKANQELIGGRICIWAEEWNL